MDRSEESRSETKPKKVAGSGKRILKLLCSYGGSIMPRAGDARLRYVGGENRLLVVNKDIRFAELMKKLENLSCSSVKLKYQLPSEDLDLLVSVTCDEDIQNMIKEYDKYENINKNKSTPSSPKLRAFLFPAKSPLDSSSRSPTHRCIDMFNDCVFLLPRSQTQHSSLETNADCYAFSDGPVSPASVRVSLVSFPSASPRSNHPPATYINYRQSLHENAHHIQNQKKKVPSEGIITNPSSPPKMSIYGQYQNQRHPQQHNRWNQHLQASQSTLKLKQYPRHYSAQINRCSGHGPCAAASHGLRQEGPCSHSQNAYVDSILTARPLQHMYGFETFGH